VLVLIPNDIVALFTIIGKGFSFLIFVFIVLVIIGGKE
jgi:hypothetical protein